MATPGNMWTLCVKNGKIKIDVAEHSQVEHGSNQTSHF